MIQTTFAAGYVWPFPPWPAKADRLQQPKVKYLKVRNYDVDTQTYETLRDVESAVKAGHKSIALIKKVVPLRESAIGSRLTVLSRSGCIKSMGLNDWVWVKPHDYRDKCEQLKAIMRNHPHKTMKELEEITRMKQIQTKIYALYDKGFISKHKAHGGLTRYSVAEH